MFLKATFLCLISKNYKFRSVCYRVCVFPSKYVTLIARTLFILFSRMFDLRNVPFTTGRVLSWHNELEPVASQQLKDMVHVQEGKFDNHTVLCPCLDSCSFLFVSSFYQAGNRQTFLVLLNICDKSLRAFKQIF